MITNTYFQVDPSIEEQWNNFLDRHPYASIYQSPVMFHAYSTVPEYEPFLILCKNDEGVTGLVSGIIQSYRKGLIRRFTSRTLITGGPLLSGDNPGEIADLILCELRRTVSRKVIYTEIRNSFNTNKIGRIFKNNGFRLTEHLNIRFDLSIPEEQLWKRVHPTRRKQIKRSERRGTRVVQEDLSPEGIDRVYDIVRLLYERIKLPLIGREVFHYFLNNPAYSNHLRMFRAINDDKTIAGRFVLAHGDCVYDWYAGSLEGSGDKYPNDLLPWEIILWAKKNGFKQFDFGGAGNPKKKYGVRDFKMKFGGDTVNYGRYHKAEKPVVFQLVRILFYLSRKISRFVS